MSVAVARSGRLHVPRPARRPFPATAGRPSQPIVFVDTVERTRHGAQPVAASGKVASMKGPLVLTARSRRGVGRCEVKPTFTDTTTRVVHSLRTCGPGNLRSCWEFGRDSRLRPRQLEYRLSCCKSRCATRASAHASSRRSTAATSSSTRPSLHDFCDAPRSGSNGVAAAAGREQQRRRARAAARPRRAVGGWSASGVPHSTTMSGGAGSDKPRVGGRPRAARAARTSAAPTRRGAICGCVRCKDRGWRRRRRRCERLFRSARGSPSDGYREKNDARAASRLACSRGDASTSTRPARAAAPALNGDLARGRASPPARAPDDERLVRRARPPPRRPPPLRRRHGERGRRRWRVRSEQMELRRTDGAAARALRARAGRVASRGERRALGAPTARRRRRNRATGRAGFVVLRGLLVSSTARDGARRRAETPRAVEARGRRKSDVARAVRAGRLAPRARPVGDARRMPPPPRRVGSPGEARAGEAPPAAVGSRARAQAESA